MSHPPLIDLISALHDLPLKDPITRARLAPKLIDAAKWVLADVRAHAIAEAVAAGSRQSDVARALGVSRNTVSVALRRARTDSEETQ